MTTSPARPADRRDAMPEGDSIRRIARWLGPALTGATLERVVVRGVPRGPIGERVASVTAIGKHLVIATDAGSAIRVHLGMNGRWSRFDPAAPIHLTDRTTLVLVTARDAFVCRNAATVEVTGRRSPGRGLGLAGLGPDILDADFDVDAVLDRIADQPATRALGEVLLDQRVVAGIGNIYRCEALFLTGVDARTAVGQLDPDTVAGALEAARTLMQESVAGRRGEPWVYRRTGEPCRRCRTPIRSYVFGDPARRVYTCERCQPAPGVAAVRPPPSV